MDRKTSDKITVMKGERKMFQSDVVQDLKKIYKQAAEYSKRKNHIDFYICLKSFLEKEACATGNKDQTLQQYMIASKAYIESDLLTFCISVIALIVSIFTMTNIKWNMSKGINIIRMVALIIIASAWPIYHHIQNRKLKEIYLVLENDKLKTCTVMNTNMKNKNLKDAD